MNPIFHYHFIIPPEAQDENGHVNNVHFVQWMQNVAVRHYEQMGGRLPTQAIGATWVVRSHQIEYLLPAFPGDRIDVRTWVATMRRVRSLRRYEFVRVLDNKLLVRGQTDWVFVNAGTGHPMAVPDNILALFTLLPDK